MITRLFLNNEEVELDNQVDFTINKAFEDITDPTTIINEWSKTVNIPFTNRNNQLFGSIFSIDRQILTGGSHPTGIYFDPTKKADFKLLYNNSLIMSGYCKLTTITINNSGSYYNINLFGQLGNIFHELQQLSFNPDLTDPSNVKYTIGKKTDDGYEPYVEEVMSKDLIKTAWTTRIIDPSLETAEWNDIIGFACCNQGYNPDFSSSAIQTGADKDEEAQKILEEHYGEAELTPKVAIDALIGDGLLPRQYGEYRSYYQTPYIYVNKMFQMLQAKCKELTDYELVLDPNWFNRNNPYYDKLVMMLNSPYTEDELHNNTYKPYFTENHFPWTITTLTRMYNFLTTYEVINELYPVYSSNRFTLTKEQGVNVNLPFTFRIQWEDILNGDVYLTNDNCLVIDSVIIDSNLQPHIVHKTVLKNHNYDYQGDDYTTVITYDGAFNKERLGSSTNFNFFYDIKDTLSYMCQYAEFGDSFSIGFYAHWENPSSPLVSRPYGTDYPQPFGQVPTDTMTIFAINDLESVDFPVVVSTRSFTTFTIGDLWDENTTFFDCILNYCKTYGILFKVDEVNKQLLLLHRTTYFKDFTIEDWSDKLDRTKDFIISPITFDTKYVSFNYEDNNTDSNESYSKKYGVNFGGLKLKTVYEFNNNNTDLFKDLKTSIVSTYTLLGWNNIYNNDIIYYQTGETMPYFENDKEKTDTFGCFYFWNGLQLFDEELGTVRITDDTQHQMVNQNYCYLQEGVIPNREVTVETFPLLDIVTGKNLCLFNNPSETYDINKLYTDKDSIYYNFWKDWIDEQYNVQNKKISCYLNIHPIDYLKFDFNHFIMIENQLYLLNKIEDYDITNPETTKCELIGIQDTNAYTTNNYFK